MFIQNLAYMRHELIHVIVGLIDIIEYIIPLDDMVDHVLYESHDISHVSHRLLVFASTHHEEFARSDLFEKVVNISAIALSENDGRTYDIDIPVGMGLIPLLKHLLGLPLRFTVMIERIRRVVLVRVVLVQSVYCHRREKDNAFYAVLLHGRNAPDPSAPDSSRRRWS